MERLEAIKECLIGAVEGQVYGGLEKADTKELGEAIDMIKDLAETMYYCSITKAMDEDAWEKESSHKGGRTMYYSPKKMMTDYPIMYASDMGRSGGSSHTGGSTHMYHEGMVRYPETVDHIYRDGMMRDPHEGKSGERRKMYMDGRHMKDKTQQMKELESYMQELSNDIVEMIADASPEEKQMLQTKMTTLAGKIK